MFFLLEKISAFLWTPVMLVLLGGASVYFTVKFKFFQIVNVKMIYENTVKTLFVKKEADKKDKISPFAAMSAALAGTMGVGNIAGVATAITAGGAGAVFWMWASAFFCMILKYIEVTLAQIYRVKDKDGKNYTGGPMYYIKKGLKSEPLAAIFTAFCILSSFGMGNMTQTNTAAQAIEGTFGISKIIVGIVLSIIVSLIIFGGVKRIVSFTSFAIPFISLLYILAAVIVLVCRSENILPSFRLIFTSAFSLEKVGAGAMGYAVTRAIRYGISRGIFSNEAGLGSAPIAHAAAENDSSVKQGMWGIFEVFLDTIAVCTVTALVILCTGAQNITGTDGMRLDGIDLTSEAFASVLGYGSDIFLALAVLVFALATVVCWSYYGECCVKFLFKSKNAANIYKALFLLCIVVGAAANTDSIWLLSDIFNALMAIPNLIAIFFLHGEVFTETQKFLKQQRQISARQK